ncbi:MAG: hypothetical protein QXI87_09505 [Thermoproteota archaeon]
MSSRSRSKRAILTPLEPSPTYWEDFLKHMGFLPEFAISPKTMTETSSQQELSEEQKIFIDRAADKLTSSRTNPNWKAPPHIRDKVRRELTEVFLGKGDLAEWFTRTRQNFNLRSFELAEILYDSLKGLKSREAQSLREQWLSFIQKERTAYGL